MRKVFKLENGETPTTCDSRGSLSNKSSEGNIDMNIVAKSDFNFKGKALVPVENITGVWLSSSDLAKALEYSNSRAVTMIYNKYADEFTSGMTQVLEVSTSGNYRKKVRVFSLRGAHLIAMFARTDVAKEFRRWVLDILDREVERSPIAKQFIDDELCSLAWLWRAGAVMNDACRGVYPLLRVAEHREAGRFYSIGQEYPRTLNNARELLKRETAHIEFQPWRDDNWSRVLPHLRQEMLQ